MTKTTDTRIVGETGYSWHVERVLGYDQMRGCVAVQLHNTASDESWFDIKSLNELRLITASGEYLTREALAAKIESMATVVIDEYGQIA